MEAFARAAFIDRPLAPPATLTPVANAGDRSTASFRIGTPRPAPSAVGIGDNGAPSSDDSSDVLSISVAGGRGLFRLRVQGTRPPDIVAI